MRVLPHRLRASILAVKTLAFRSFHGSPATSPITDITASFVAFSRSSAIVSTSKPNSALHPGHNGSSRPRLFHRSAEVLARPKMAPPEVKPARPRKAPRPAPVDAPYRPPAASETAKPKPMQMVEIHDSLTVKQLADRLQQSSENVMAMLVNLGESATSVAEIVGMDAAELVALEFGYNVKRTMPSSHAKRKQDSMTTELLPRPAVITVMGHVDHGKTSLLDALRHTSVAAKEVGGITQHVGAFVVNMPSGASLTFLDTPGHAAFSAMRARGAAVTDIVVLVVAADDGVMPQTREAMAHAKAANVPMVVAINKCDKAAANPARVRQQLCAEGVELEDIGGDVQVVEISAINKTGLEKLEEALLLQAELMDLRAFVNGDARAVVVEARLDQGHGPLATIIVQAGTFTSGLHVVVGTEWGRIRVMRDTWGHQVKCAGPSMPVEIEGLKGLPLAGDEVIVVANEERARKLSHGRKNRMREEKISTVNLRPATETSEDGDQYQNSEVVELAFVLKADVQGTVEAVSEALKSLNSPQVTVNIVHAGVGLITQSDVDLAQACGACIVGFNVRNLAASVETAARHANVDRTKIGSWDQKELYNFSLCTKLA